MSPFGEGDVASEMWRNWTPRWGDVSLSGEGHVASEPWRSWTPRWDEGKVSGTRSARRRQRHAETTLRRPNMNYNDNTNNHTTTQRLDKHDTPTIWRQYTNTAVQGTIGQQDGGGGGLARDGGEVDSGWWWDGGGPWWRRGGQWWLVWSFGNVVVDGPAMEK